MNSCALKIATEEHDVMPTIKRVWAMPCSDTFSIKPIGAFVYKYLAESKISIDPFARNKKWATYTNDLNPKTEAEYHMEAADFLYKLVGQNIKADLVIFDPPYSTRQIKECYDGIGKRGLRKTCKLLGRSGKNILMTFVLLRPQFFLSDGIQ